MVSSSPLLQSYPFANSGEPRSERRRAYFGSTVRYTKPALRALTASSSHAKALSIFPARITKMAIRNGDTYSLAARLSSA